MSVKPDNVDSDVWDALPYAIRKELSEASQLSVKRAVEYSPINILKQPKFIFDTNAVETEELFFDNDFTAAPSSIDGRGGISVYHHHFRPP